MGRLQNNFRTNQRVLEIGREYKVRFILPVRLLTVERTLSKYLMRNAP